MESVHEPDDRKADLFKSLLMTTMNNNVIQRNIFDVLVLILLDGKSEKEKEKFNEIIAKNDDGNREISHELLVLIS